MRTKDVEATDEAALATVVERAASGDQEAFADLYRRFAGRVYGLSKHLLGSAEAARDAQSEVFLKMQRVLATYDPAQPFARWLLSVTSHHCLDVLRRRRLEARLFVPEAAEPAPEISTPPLSQTMIEERGEEVREAVARLPEQYRVPLTLRYYGELSYDEIAAQLGLTRNHVATLIFRAKQELRRMLGGKKELKR